ncbi:MBL fold metallo-hydrolase [Bacteroidota bacterium]
MIRIERIVVGNWKENTFLLIKNNKLWIIDPGDEFVEIDRVICNLNLTPIGIINTHGHFDHIGAVAELQEKYDIPFYIHASDKQLVRQANLYRKIAGENGIIKTPKIDYYLNKLSEIELDGIKIYIFHTPGHTKGSLTFMIQEHVFIGDLFFNNELARTDLPGGNVEQLKQSIKFVLANFKNMNIHTGHGVSFELNNKSIENMEKLVYGLSN